MIAVHPPWRRWSLLLVVAWATIDFPSETTALQGRSYLDSISPQHSRLNSAETPSSSAAAASPPTSITSSLSNVAQATDGSHGKVQMGDPQSPILHPLPQPPLLNSDMNGVKSNGTVDESSLLPASTAAAMRLSTNSATGSYLDSLKHLSASSFPTDTNIESFLVDSESSARNGLFVEKSVSSEQTLSKDPLQGPFDTSSSSSSSPYSLNGGDLSYADWLAAQYQNPFINGIATPTPTTSLSTFSPETSPPQQQQQQQQQDPHSTFSMNGDGTIPQSTVGPAATGVVVSSSQSSTASDGGITSAGGFASKTPMINTDDALPKTVDFYAAAKVQNNDPSDKESSRSAAVVGEISPPAKSSDAYFAIPHRPDAPPPLPRLKSPTTQSYSNFAGQQPATSSFFVKEQQQQETPFFISGVSDVPDDSISITSQNGLPNPLQSMIDNQIELIHMQDIAERTREFLGPIGETLKENVKENGEYWRKQTRLMASGGVSIQGDIEGERKAPEDLNTVGMTERIMKSIPPETQATGAGGASTWEAFQNAEANWARLKHYMPHRDDPVSPPFVTENRIIDGNFQCYRKLEEQKGKKLDYDIVVCGGTLGIFFATALQLRGHRVCLVEAGKVRGREQEWNISMDQLLLLKKLGIVTQEDIDEAVKTEFPGCRAGFKNREIEVEGGYIDNGIGFECFAEGVLNLGVSPKILLERVSNTFKSLGGIIREDARLNGIAVETDVGAALMIGEEEEPITARLVIDAMGNNSPIMRQQRYDMKPDGVCVVVGSCASGFDAATNTIGDIIYTNTPIQDKGDNGGKMQYFWEAFPVGIGRNGQGTSDVKTTYMFTYIDADQRRPTLESLMEDYWRLLPQYQPSISNPETDLDVRRVLFAYFPTYRKSPLQLQFSRILAVGDASGIQSPLSFGGFGALTRHLERITTAVTEAVDIDILSKENLAYINPYTPNLSATWMFQKAMSVKVGQRFVDRRAINRLLATNFEVMDKMGQSTIKPFLQDVVRFDGLVSTLGKSVVADPTFMPQIVGWVGVPTLVDFFGHVGMMGLYAGLDNFLTPWLRPVADATLRNEETRYRLHRQMDAWRYGCGNDYDVKSIPKAKSNF